MIWYVGRLLWYLQYIFRYAIEASHIGGSTVEASGMTRSNSHYWYNYFFTSFSTNTHKTYCRFSWWSVIHWIMDDNFGRWCSWFYCWQNLFYITLNTLHYILVFFYRPLFNFFPLFLTINYFSYFSFLLYNHLLIE